MADDKIRSGDPEKRKKKPAAKPPVDEEVEERPRKKKRPADEVEEELPRKKKRPVAEDDDDDVPKRKKRRRDDDDEEPSESGSSALSAILPVGGSVFGLVSMWVGVLSVIMGLVALGSLFDIFTVAGMKIPPIATCFMPMLWPLALLSGGLSFFTQKHKASYGSIAGNMRAIIGILLSLGALVIHAIIVYLFFKGG
jgi:hypothetical protein